MSRNGSTSPGKVHEQEFNHALGAALGDTRTRWRENPSIIVAERLGLLRGDSGKSAGRADILVVDPQMPPVAIECSFSDRDADNDAKKRLGLRVKGSGRIQSAISVLIPKKFRKIANPKRELANEATIHYALYQTSKDGMRRWPESGFIDGNVQNLADLLSAASLPKEEIERTAEQVALLIDEAAHRLETLPNATKNQIGELINQRSILTSLKTAMVLWLDALLTQQRLHGQNVEDAPPLDFSGDTLPRIRDQSRIWKKIRKKNWRAIFEPAIKVLEVAGNSDPLRTGEALKKLTQAVEQIEQANLGLHINVGAELFPKLSDDRKQAAAYYTQPATAELLAALTIRPENLTDEEWKDPNLFSKRRMGDLACGTGTLLRAGYRQVQAFHESKGGTTKTVTELHQQAMETGLIGTDISPIAAHLTSASLAAIGQGKPYGDTQIGWVEIGGKTGTAGSLEYFAAWKLEDMFDSIGGSSTGADQGDASNVRVPDRGLDWTLMNPPYSRTRGGQSAFDVSGIKSNKEREACQKRWSVLIKNEPADKRAGLAASFLALARQKTKPGGRIGFVLPLTAAFADTWRKTRGMIEHKFTDILAVAVSAGQALGDEALSADTNMEEMLLIAKRRENPGVLGRRALVKCATLFSPVTRGGEAGEIARAILAAVEKTNNAGTSYPIRIGQHEIGLMYVFDPGEKSNPWSPLGTTNPHLASAADRLSRGLIDFNNNSIELPIEMTSMEQLFSVGPTHHLIGYPTGKSERGAFEFHPLRQSTPTGSDLSLWAADSKTQNQLVIDPTHKGSPIPEKAQEAKNMRAEQSKLFYARNMRWTSQSLLTASTKRNAMGGRGWTTLIHRNPQVCEMFALWANSTFGMLVHWTQGQRTQAGRSTTQIGALKKIPVPRFDNLSEEALELAEAKFEELKTKTLQRAKNVDKDKTRHEIDQAVIEILELPDWTEEIIEDLRAL